MAATASGLWETQRWLPLKLSVELAESHPKRTLWAPTGFNFWVWSKRHPSSNTGPYFFKCFCHPARRASLWETTVILRRIDPTSARPSVFLFKRRQSVDSTNYLDEKRPSESVIEKAIIWLRPSAAGLPESPVIRLRLASCGQTVFFTASHKINSLLRFPFPAAKLRRQLGSVIKTSLNISESLFCKKKQKNKSVFNPELDKRSRRRFFSDKRWSI